MLRLKAIPCAVSEPRGLLVEHVFRHIALVHIFTFTLKEKKTADGFFLNALFKL